MVCNLIEFVFLMDKYPNHNIKVKEDEKMETCFKQLNKLIKNCREREVEILSSFKFLTYWLFLNFKIHQIQHIFS